MTSTHARLFVRTVIHGVSLVSLILLIALPLNEYVWMLADDPNLILAALPDDPKEPAKRELIGIGCTLIALVQGLLFATSRTRGERVFPGVIIAAAAVTALVKLTI